MVQSSALADTDNGAFARKESVWRDQISPDGRFKPEADRYHLYVSLACPWANRCLAALFLKGLEHVVGVSITHPTWQRTRDLDSDLHCGWVFAQPNDPPLTSSTGHGSFSCEGCVPDSVNHVRSVRELYKLAGQEGGRFTVPVLWDKQLKTVVNNESSEILRMFNSQFNHLARCPEVDLYPEALRPAIDSVNEWVYRQINNGVYRCGFAQKQEAYDTAFTCVALVRAAGRRGELVSGLQRCEEVLSRQRYLTGAAFTEADLRLFMTTNWDMLRHYPALSNYTRELYQMPAIRRAIDIRHIKVHYFTSHPTLNYYAIVPKGGPAWWEEPHNRDALFPVLKASI
ncbi:hypothetical protein QJQ45_001837 [Haematococcus lacustris]|nr:hypothetical protein QJQ45_001837 [Haematococcus lacustris]